MRTPAVIGFRARFVDQLVTSRTYDPLTGRLTKVKTDGTVLVQQLDYVYDKSGNLVVRTDSSDPDAKRTEGFMYDTLDRVTEWFEAR